MSKKANKKMISIRLSEGLIAQVKQAAKADNVTATKIIERALAAELKER